MLTPQGYLPESKSQNSVVINVSSYDPIVLADDRCQIIERQ